MKVFGDPKAKAKVRKYIVWGVEDGIVCASFLGGIALGTAAALLIYHGMRLISKLRGTNLEAASPASAPSGSELEGEAYSKRHRSPAPQADA